MSEPEPLTPSERLLFHYLEAKAEAGEKCPANAAIADDLGKSALSVTAHLANLERKRWISVERGCKLRAVTIVRSGARTAGDVGPPHWRYRNRTPEDEAAARIEAELRALVKDSPLALVEPPSVMRDPCGYCGTRPEFAEQFGCRACRAPQRAVAR